MGQTTYFWSIFKDGYWQNQYQCGGTSCTLTFTALSNSIAVLISADYRMGQPDGALVPVHQDILAEIRVVSALMNASISGPQALYPGTSCTWTAYVNNGVPPFTFAWSGVLSYTSASTSGRSGEVVGSPDRTGYLIVTITDSWKQRTQAQLPIEMAVDFPASCYARPVY